MGDNSPTAAPTTPALTGSTTSKLYSHEDNKMSGHLTTSKIGGPNFESGVMSDEGSSESVARLKMKLRMVKEELRELRERNNARDVRGGMGRERDRERDTHTHTLTHSHTIGLSIDELRAELMAQEDRIAYAERAMRDSTRLQRSSVNAAKSIIETLADAAGSAAGLDLSLLPSAVRKRVETILGFKGGNISADDAMAVLTDAAYGFAVAVHILCAQNDQ
eukprot:gnl/Chilomastix_caulleri/1085.p1 GENE.gnl/Chilomastix_caulleri/1085~~gnl/Chilomastix_caulleri/1085.p1  ORF type:complete len:220 (+),score=73.81 gnl/Chilomastix_caulleri/1085:146-805(+)